MNTISEFDMDINNKFNSAVEYVLNHEGGLVNNPNDPGGITKYGISLRFLRSFSTEQIKKYGYFSVIAEPEFIINLSIEKAEEIYKGEFWDHAPFEEINNQECCNFIFDMAVNMGINPAIKCAQRACWAVMKDRNVIEDDGILGNKTIYLINVCDKYLLPSMKSERAGYYRLIVEKNHSQQEFLDGWLNRAYGK